MNFHPLIACLKGRTSFCPRLHLLLHLSSPSRWPTPPETARSLWLRNQPGFQPAFQTGTFPTNPSFASSPYGIPLKWPIFIHMGVSENVVYPIVPNGFADHYPYEKWLAIIGNINPTFSGPNPSFPSPKNLDPRCWFATFNRRQDAVHLEKRRCFRGPQKTLFFLFFFESSSLPLFMVHICSYILLYPF